LGKAKISFVMSFRLSAWNNSVPTGWIFMAFDIGYFSGVCREIQVSLHSDKNNGYFSWRPT